MHAESMKSMTDALENIREKVPPQARVLDVGSYDVNGTYRPLVEGLGWSYVGCDIQPGPNVDVVSDSPSGLPFCEEFDVVISGQMLEHSEDPQEIVLAMARALRPGGYLVINTHHSFAEHRFPADYWRFMQDGLLLLFVRTQLLEALDVRYIDRRDIQGIARRK